MNRPNPRLLTVLWAAGSLIAIKSFLTRLFDPDLWWHLALARQMVAEGHVTRTDIFSYTAVGTPYLNFEWLAQLGFYAAWLAGGAAGIFTLRLVAGLGIAVLMGAAFRRWGARGNALFFLWWSAFWLLRPRLNERPELVTLVGMAALICLVHRALESPAKRRGVMVAGAALMVIWSNSHGGWVFAPALVGLLAVGAWWSESHRPSARFLLGFSFLLGAAGLVGPYGPRVLLVHTIHFSYLVKQGLVANIIQEWMPTTVGRAPMFWVMLIATVAALGEGFLRRRTSARLWAPALLVFGAWGAAYYRNAGLFAFIAGPFLAMWLSEGVPFRWGRWVLALPAVVALADAAPALARPLPPALIQHQRLPEAACRFLVEENIRGRMFNVLEQGGYIEWTLGPDRKIFMDGRYTFFPQMREVAEAARSGTLGAMIARYDMDHAIVSHGFLDVVKAEGSTLFPPAAWALVQWDDTGLVYLKRVPAFADVIARREYRWARPDGGRSPGDPDRRLFRAEMERHHRETPFSLLGQALEASLSGGD